MNTSVNDIGQYTHTFLNQVVDFLPKLLAAIVILIIGYIIAKVIASLIKGALEKVGLNRRLHSVRGGETISRAVPDPAGLIGTITFWLIFLFVLSVAATALGVPAINDFLHGVFGYIPNVIAALLIFIVAGAVSAAVSSVIASTMGSTATGKIAATAAPIVVMGLATFMILNQLQIAPEIVTITYAGLVGTAVLAFGLGGRDAASRMLSSLYDSSLEQKDTAVSDIKRGAENAKAKAQDLRGRVR